MYARAVDKSGRVGSSKNTKVTVITQNPDNYDWSKSIACNATKFKEVIDNGKFASYIEHQQFRNAMYDCRSVTTSIISNSSRALTAMKNSSRYQLVNARVTSGRTCKYRPKKRTYSNKDYCGKVVSASYWYENSPDDIIPDVPYDTADLTLTRAYEGKSFVFSATQKDELPNSRWDDNGYGYWQNTTTLTDQFGHAYIIVGQIGGEKVSQTMGSSTEGTSGYSSRPINAFVPNTYVTGVQVRTYYQGTSSNISSEAYIEYAWHNTTYYIQIFKI